MSGIQLHPHDILDEGMPQIMSYIRKLKDVRYIFPEVNTIFERNPNPVGNLPRNAVHEVVFGTGTMHAILPSYQGLDQRREPGLSDEQDPLMIIKESLQEEHYEIIPWLNILNGHFEGPLLALIWLRIWMDKSFRTGSVPMHRMSSTSGNKH